MHRRLLPHLPSAPTGLAALLTGLALAAAAPAAHADSIAYVKDGDIHLVTADGNRDYRVTTGGGYSSVSQSDAGKLIGLKGNRITVVDRFSGAVVTDFVPVASGTAGTITLSGPFDPAISPDGTRIAYGLYVQYTHGDPNCGLPGGCWEGHLYAGTGYSPSDRPADWSQDAWKPNYGWMDPSWIDDDHTLLSGPSSAYLDHAGIDTLGDDKHEATRWFSDHSEGVQNLFDGELNRQKTGAAFIRNSTGDALRVYRVTGAPPAGGDPAGCLTAPARGFGAYESPSWAPDGEHLAWSDDSGIYVADLPGFAQGCPAASAVKVVQIAAGGKRPDWGPADVPLESQRPAAPAQSGTGSASAGSPGGSASGVGGPGTVALNPGPGGGTAVAGAQPRAKVLARTRGTLRLRVTLPGAGTLRGTIAAGRRTVGHVGPRTVRAAGDITLTVRLGRAARSAKKLAVRVTFTPAGGGAPKTIRLTARR